MLPAEPGPTAWALLVFGALLVVSVLFSRAAERTGVPLVLLFLVVGMLAGREGFGHIAFESYALTFRVGTVALVLILFDGGLNTPWIAIRQGIRPAVALATVGVAGTATVVAVGAHLFGAPWREALLLGAIVSSTDAAAVFAVLRGSGLQLKRRVGVTLELESGLNDPMAVIMMLALTRSLVTGGGLGWKVLAEIALQLVVGVAAGAAIGFGGRQLLRRVRLGAAGLYPVLTLALAFAAFGAPTLFFGSGFLAVYVAAVILGNGPLPYRGGILRVHDFIAWFSQIVMFLLLGLLVLPSRLVSVAPLGLGLALFLAVVARPAVVCACLAPFRYTLREMTYVGWVGLRGAVPIILATYPVMARAPGAQRIFDVVFFIVVVNTLVPGATVRWVTRRLGLESPRMAPSLAAVEIVSTRLQKGEVLSFYVGQASAVCGSRISELPFPSDSVVMLIARGEELVAPRGETVLQAEDHVHVYCRTEDRPLVHLLFGQPEEG